jgi:beta-lactamase class A
VGVKDLLRAVEGAGTFSVWQGGLDGRPVFTYAAEHLHYSASTMKLPVAIALMRAVEAGELDLAQWVTVHNDFASATGTDRFGVRREEDDAPDTWDHLGGQVELRWLAEQMITLSSNLATDLILELVGVDASDQALTDAITAQRPSNRHGPSGATEEGADGWSSIRRGIDDRPAQAAGISNVMSAAGLAAVLVAVGNDTAAGPESCRYLRDLLAANEWNDQIPAGLPDGVRVEHKNGWDTGIRHDGGIVRPDDAEPFVLSVCTTSELDDDAAQRLIADIAAVAWQHRHDLGGVS